MPCACGRLRFPQVLPRRKSWGQGNRGQADSAWHVLTCVGKLVKVPVAKPWALPPALPMPERKLRMTCNMPKATARPTRGAKSPEPHERTNAETQRATLRQPQAARSAKRCATPKIKLGAEMPEGRGGETAHRVTESSATCLSRERQGPPQVTHRGCCALTGSPQRNPREGDRRVVELPGEGISDGVPLRGDVAHAECPTSPLLSPRDFASDCSHNASACRSSEFCGLDPRKVK